MLAISVNLQKRLYFRKFRSGLVSRGLSVEFVSRDLTAEGSRPGAINAIASDDTGIGKYRRLY